MQTFEKFCLKWNDFQENFNTAFKDLRRVKGASNFKEFGNNTGEGGRFKGKATHPNAVE